MHSLIETGKVYTTRYVGELTRFVTAGSMAAGTHLGVLYLLTEFTPMWYLQSTVVGFGAGFAVSFTLQKYWTFRERTSDRMYGQLFSYFLLQASGLIINASGLYFLVEYVGLWYLGAQAGLLVLVAGITYTLSKWVIFKEPLEKSHSVSI